MEKITIIERENAITFTTQAQPKNTVLGQFEDYLRAIRGYSENTVKAYLTDLHTFVYWGRTHGVLTRWSCISREQIDAFLIYQESMGVKPTTTNRQLASISSLYGYFQRQGLQIENPCKYESRRKVGKTEPCTIPLEQLILAYHKAQGSTKTMLGILMTTGIRLQELLDLNFEDIDFSTNQLHIHGKGKKERKVYSNELALAKLRETQERYHASGKIFHTTQRHVRRQIYAALLPYCNAPQLSPHAIRHTYATHLAKQGVPTTTISKILGHEHISTSEKYVNSTELSTAQVGILTN